MEKDKNKLSFFERISGNRKDSPVEDDLLDLVDESADIAEDEKRMIRDIIDLGGTVAGEICTPRVDVMLAHDTESGRSALERMRGTGYSRLPVCHDDIDHIVGIVNYKDLIGPLMDGSIDDDVLKFSYEPTFVPESKSVIPLLGEMQASHRQMVIAVDEYGGTEGIITIEDIVEEIVGEIADESDIVGELIASVASDTWWVDGRFPVEDALELGWPVQESDDYETIAGWFLSNFDSVPEAGDSIQEEGYLFTIIKMRRSRISRIRVQKLDAQVGTKSDSASAQGEEVLVNTGAADAQEAK